jgi:hypothetical protein
MFNIGTKVKIILNNGNDSHDYLIGKEGIIIDNLYKYQEYHKWIVEIPGNESLVFDENELKPI